MVEMKVSNETSKNNTNENSRTSRSSPDMRMNKQHVAQLVLISVSVIAIAFAILIPTVIWRTDNDEWTMTQLDVFTVSVLLDNVTEGSELRPLKNYGEYIVLSANGDRLVATSDLCEGYIQVWDYTKSEEGQSSPQWIFKARLSPQEGTEYSYYPEGLGISDDGSRIIYSSNGQVRVFEDVTGSGTEWSQVGETLVAWSFATVFDFATYFPDDILPFDRSYAETVSVSSNGSIIAVAAPYSLDDLTPMREPCYGYPDAPGCLCAVQVFQHVDLLPLNPSDTVAQHKTWIPRGQLIFEKDEDEFFGRDVHLSSDGNRLVVAVRGKAVVSVYDFDGDHWQKRQDITGTPGFSGPRPSAAASLSRNGQVLAIRYGQANSLDSGYTLWFDSNVHLYEYDDSTKTFSYCATIQDVAGGEKDGTAMALSDNHVFVFGGAYELLRVFEYHEGSGKWKQRFELQKSRKTVAINADGTRIASGSPPMSAYLPYSGGDDDFCSFTKFLRGRDNEGFLHVYDRR